MKRKLVALLLLFAPLFALAGDAPIIGRLNRVALVVNDQASFSIVGSTWAVMMTRSIPVVLDNTVQAQSVGFATLVWSDLRAHKAFSEKLYASTQDFQFKKVIAEQIKRVLAGSPATVTETPEVAAAITRAGINHPVKFVANEMGPVERPGVAKSKNYGDWERAVVAELKKSNAADTLLITNVLLWGIRMGGAKCEQQTGGETAVRALMTSNLTSLANDACARTMLNVNNRLINLADGNVIAEYNSSYVVEAGSTEQYLADSAAAFKRDSTCVVTWYAENLKRAMSGTEQLNSYNCKPNEK